MTWSPNLDYETWSPDTAHNLMQAISRSPDFSSPQTATTVRSTILNLTTSPPVQPERQRAFHLKPARPSIVRGRDNRVSV